jgi:DnaK suppressor protein
MRTNSQETEAYRRTLEARRVELIARQRKAEDIVIERVADSTDESVLANQRDLAVDTLNREAVVLRLVTEALQRIGAGEYGFCMECTEPISAKRLAALPWAALCLMCQEAADGLNRTAGNGSQSWFPDAA